MATDTIAITPGSGQLLDAIKLNNGANDVEREVTVIGSPTVFANIAEVNASMELKVAASAHYASPTTSPLLQAAISFSASGNNAVIAAVGGQTVRVYKMWIVFGGACNFKFGDTTPAYFSGAAPTTQYGSFTLVLDGDPHYITASGKGFTINTDAAVQVSGTIWYTQS